MPAKQHDGMTWRPTPLLTWGLQLENLMDRFFGNMGCKGTSSRNHHWNGLRTSYCPAQVRHWQFVKFPPFSTVQSSPSSYLTVPTDNVDQHCNILDGYPTVQAKCPSLNKADVVIAATPNGCHFDQSATLKISCWLRGSQNKTFRDLIFSHELSLSSFKLKYG